MPDRIRQNVYELGAPWAEPILWYARAVDELKRRALRNPVSWGFFGAIHGFESDIWREYGYYRPDECLPAIGVREEFWNQCQHGTWYFLPWHRGYLWAMEKVLLDVVVELGGPEDWALCYWDYSRLNQNRLPPEFRTPEWPDCNVGNPLYVRQRYGPDNDGDNVYVPRDRINLDALAQANFRGPGGGGGTGFGGVETGFRHNNVGGGGRLEIQPHNAVHVFVGGRKPWSTKVGLMTSPTTAALDPIFWLHHANIDRLWEVWIRNPPATHADPVQPRWEGGPAYDGGRQFLMPLTRTRTWTFTPLGVKDIRLLEYTYDDLGPPAIAAPVPGDRLRKLVAAKGSTESQEATAMAEREGDKVELIGASRGALRLAGGRGVATVGFDRAMSRKVIDSFATAAQTGVPDRVFLNLENVRGNSDGIVLEVRVGARGDPRSLAGPESLAGVLGMFGLEEATREDGPHAGEGMSFALDITDIIDDLHLGGDWTFEQLAVRITPTQPLPDWMRLAIGRISVFRQGL